ncbi:hypothetical protein [Afifella sp. IM 167]|uniref:hypothetical protein n=1 Tax=Afifella sp. IM 167 TaxID=2033586 RepID=UPI001CCE4D53|nr:hypothetical protein [Afifella sp. IM 167]MBZ8131876.1 hypothetical protein [Afifella sp. IM 167]
MPAPWINFTLLALESQQVIWLRLMKLAAGGPAACSEARQMVEEKLAAGSDAAGQILAGEPPEAIVDGYLGRVRANLKRLSK